MAKLVTDAASKHTGSSSRRCHVPCDGQSDGEDAVVTMHVMTLLDKLMRDALAS